MPDVSTRCARRVCVAPDGRSLAAASTRTAGALEQAVRSVSHCLSRCSRSRPCITMTLTSPGRPNVEPMRASSAAASVTDRSRSNVGFTLIRVAAMPSSTVAAIDPPIIAVRCRTIHVARRGRTSARCAVRELGEAASRGQETAWRVRIRPCCVRPASQAPADSENPRTSVRKMSPLSSTYRATCSSRVLQGLELPRLRRAREPVPGDVTRTAARRRRRPGRTALRPSRWPRPTRWRL